jgi:hypothetical protein
VKLVFWTPGVRVLHSTLRCAASSLPTPAAFFAHSAGCIAVFSMHRQILFTLRNAALACSMFCSEQSCLHPYADLTCTFFASYPFLFLAPSRSTRAFQRIHQSPLSSEISQRPAIGISEPVAHTHDPRSNTGIWKIFAVCWR